MLIDQFYDSVIPGAHDGLLVNTHSPKRQVVQQKSFSKFGYLTKKW